MLLCGCASTIQTKTVYKDRIVTVYEKDSIFIKERSDSNTQTRNDTVYIHTTDTREIIKYAYKHKTDTLTQIDSIPYPVEVEVNRLTDWQKKQIGGFWILLVAIFLFIGWKVRCFVVK